MQVCSGVRRIPRSRRISSRQSEATLLDVVEGADRPHRFVIDHTSTASRLQNHDAHSVSDHVVELSGDPGPLGDRDLTGPCVRAVSLASHLLGLVPLASYDGSGEQHDPTEDDERHGLADGVLRAWTSDEHRNHDRHRGRRCGGPPGRGVCRQPVEHDQHDDDFAVHVRSGHDRRLEHEHRADKGGDKQRVHPSPHQRHPDGERDDQMERGRSGHRGAFERVVGVELGHTERRSVPPTGSRPIGAALAAPLTWTEYRKEVAPDASYERTTTNRPASSESLTTPAPGHT